MARSTSIVALPASPEVRALERIGRLLAMIATKEMIQKDQVLFLRGAGFDIQEIAEIVGITPHNVSVTLHSAKGRKPRPRANK